MIEQLADPVADGQTWARRQQDAFSQWVMNLGGGDAGRWDFGLDSLNVLSYSIFGQFPTKEMIENLDNAGFAEPRHPRKPARHGEGRGGCSLGGLGSPA